MEFNHNSITKDFKSLKKFNWNLFISLCLLALAPAIYQTVRTFLISYTVSTGALDVIGQMEWFDLINETIQAFLIIPLYSILNAFYKKNNNFGKTVFKVGLVALTLYAIFSIVVYVYAMKLVGFMNPDQVDIQAVTNYVRLETIAFSIGIIVAYISVVFVVIGKSKNIYFFLVIKAVLMVISDFVLIPRFGVSGLAYSNIMVNSILAIASILILYFEHSLTPAWFHKGDGQIFKDWGRIGFFSGSQSFIDNIVYALMICKMVNAISEQGNYWIANNFIWGWLLIPVIALSEIIRRDCKDGYFKLDQKNYYIVTLFIMIIWAISIPGWTWFYSTAQKLENADEIFLITIKLLPFYLFYALSVIPDNVFIGLGKTKYSAINSLIVNSVYYGIFFILYKNSIITMNMNMIIIMFGFGIIVHWVISLIEEKLFLKKEMRKIENTNKSQHQL